MNVDVYAARAPLGAAWFATRVTRVETGDQSLDALVASRSPADVAVLGLEQDPPIAPADARARLIDRGVDRFVYETDSTRAGFLVLSQIWYPGWTLDVDGAPIEIYRAHHALLGAIVPAGKHVLTLRMTAPALVFGVGFAAIGTLACLAVIGIGRRRTDAARAST
jgi:hypothetical protein